MSQESSTGITDFLVGVAKRICDVIGIDATLRLVSECGGTTFRLPAVRLDGNDDFERLAEIVGRPEAHRICNAYANKKCLYVPRLDSAFRHAQFHEIKIRFRELRNSVGAKSAVSTICEELRISERSIWRIISRPDSQSGAQHGSGSKNRCDLAELDKDLDALMPEQATQLCAVLGRDVTLQLLNEFGGQQIEFPKDMANAKMPVLLRVLSSIGPDNFEKLCISFGGELLYLPMLHDALLKMRDRTIQRDFDKLSASHTANETVGILARRHKLSDRHIWRILKKTNEVVVRAKGATSQTPRARLNRSKGTLERDLAIATFFDAVSAHMTVARAVDAITVKFCISERTAYRILAQEGRGISRAEKSRRPVVGVSHPFPRVTERVETIDAKHTGMASSAKQPRSAQDPQAESVKSAPEALACFGV